MKRTILKKLTACLCLCAVLSGALTVPAGAAFAMKISDGFAGRKKTQEGLLGLIQNAGLLVTMAAPPSVWMLRRSSP